MTMTMTQALVFYLDTANHVALAINSPNRAWFQEPLGTETIAMHPQSRLAATLGPNGPVAFFQEASGDICGIEVSRPGMVEFVYVPGMPTKAVPGTPLGVAIGNDQVHLLYVHQDTSIHVSVKDGDHWTGAYHCRQLAGWGGYGLLTLTLTGADR